MDGFAYNSDYGTVELAVSHLNEEVSNTVARHFAPLARFEHHHGKKYKRAVVGFVGAINQMALAYRQQLEGVAREITRCAGEGWDKKPEIIRLWTRYAEVVTNFSEHPTKKVATLVIGKDNILESYAANRVPDEVEVRGGHYVKGVRKNYIVCSERMALANFLGLRLQQIPSDVKISGHERESVIRGNIAAFSDAITAAGRHSAELRESIVLVTTTPCEMCTDALTAFHPRAVYADSRSGKHYTRNVDFKRVENTFGAQGIELRDLRL